MGSRPLLARDWFVRFARCRAVATPRKERALARFLVLTLLFLLAGGSVRAQNGPDNDPDGLRGYVDNVFHHTQVDSVNLYSGLLTVPIAVGQSYPIGPKLKFQVMLAYSSRLNEYGHPSLPNPNYTYFPYSGHSFRRDHYY